MRQLHSTTPAVVAAMAALLFTPVDVWGQSSARRVAVVAELERAHITEDDGFLGAGLGGSVGIEYRPGPSVAFGIEVGRQHHVRDLQFFAVAFDPTGRVEPVPYTSRWEGDATYLFGRVSRTFGDSAGAVRPVVWGGVGVMHHGGTTRGPRTMPHVPAGYTLQPGELDVFVGRSTTAGAFEGGGGVELRITDLWSAQPFGAFRFVNTENRGPKYVIRTGVRVTLRW